MISFPGTLYLRSAVSDTFPEGTNWEPVLHSVSEVSVNHNDQVKFSRSNGYVWYNFAAAVLLVGQKF